MCVHCGREIRHDFLAVIRLSCFERFKILPEGLEVVEWDLSSIFCCSSHVMVACARNGLGEGEGKVTSTLPDLRLCGHYRKETGMKFSA